MILIIVGGQATGKTHNAEAFKSHYGLKNIVDGWDGRIQLKDGDLALTDRLPKDFPETAIVIPIDTALRAIGKEPFRFNTARSSVSAEPSSSSSEPSYTPPAPVVDYTPAPDYTPSSDSGYSDSSSSNSDYSGGGGDYSGSGASSDW